MSKAQSPISSPKNKVQLKMILKDVLHLTKTLLLIVGGIALTITSQAQENMMAAGNMQFTLHYGFMNRANAELNNSLYDIENRNYSLAPFETEVNFSTPLGATFEYAISDYTTVGFTTDFMQYTLSETRFDAVDSFSIETKGTRITALGRVVRYLRNKPRSTIYAFADVGVKIRSLNSSAANEYEENIAFIHQSHETTFRKYSPLHYDIGVGAKFLFVKNIGFCLEAGYMTSIARVGIFYNLKHKDRRFSDKYGW
jgi:hypothetical protein